MLFLYFYRCLSVGILFLIWFLVVPTLNLLLVQFVFVECARVSLVLAWCVRVTLVLVFVIVILFWFVFVVLMI
jgi:hypothetical protein